MYHRQTGVQPIVSMRCVRNLLALRCIGRARALGGSGRIRVVLTGVPLAIRGMIALLAGLPGRCRHRIGARLARGCIRGMLGMLALLAGLPGRCIAARGRIGTLVAWRCIGILLARGRILVMLARGRIGTLVPWRWSILACGRVLVMLARGCVLVRLGRGCIGAMVRMRCMRAQLTWIRIGATTGV